MYELSCLHGSEGIGACVDEFPVGSLLPGTSISTRIIPINI